MMKDAKIEYTNHRGERFFRHIAVINLIFGKTKWHSKNQWLLQAYDYEKKAIRFFVMDDVHSWETYGETAGFVRDCHSCKKSTVCEIPNGQLYRDLKNISHYSTSSEVKSLIARLCRYYEYTKSATERMGEIEITTGDYSND